MVQHKTEEIEGQAEAVIDNAVMKEDTAMHSRKRDGEWKMTRSEEEECGRGMKRSNRGGHVKDAAAAWMVGDKMPQIPGWRGDKMPQMPGRRGQDAADGRSASAQKQDSSHCIGGVQQLATQWTRTPPTQGRGRTRSTGATKSTAAEELASVLVGSTRNLRRLPPWFSVGL
jgi:hypothetical protein